MSDSPCLCSLCSRSPYAHSHKPPSACSRPFVDWNVEGSLRRFGCSAKTLLLEYEREKVLKW